eukprot:sb/3462402/
MVKHKPTTGPDGISYGDLAVVWELLIDPIRSIYTDCFVLRSLPDAWLDTKGILLPKSGKPRDSKLGYRVISIMPCLYKLYERLLLWHIEHDLGIMAKLADQQLGFRKGASTSLAILKTVLKIEEALDENKFCLGLFVDFSRAFDTVAPDTILDALSQLGVPVDIISSLGYYFTNRRVSLTLGGQKITRTGLDGTPAGGVASPFCWNAATRELVLELNSIEYTISWADDFVTLIKASSIAECINRAQRIVDELLLWSEVSGVALNPDKTCWVLFSRKHKKNRVVPPGLAIRVGNKELKQVQETRYLGVILQESLRWGPHIQKVTRETQVLMQNLIKLGHRHWGSHPNIIRRLYQSVIVPKATYGAIAWCHKLKALEQKLDQISATAAKATIGGGRTAPNLQTTLLAGLHPLSKVAKTRAEMEATKLLPSPFLETKKLHVPNLDRRFSVHVDDGMQLSAAEHLGGIEAIEYYTDGSVFPKTGEAGSGWVRYGQGPKLALGTKLNKWASIYQAELVAIREAALQELSTTIHPQSASRPILIFSDSQAALLGLTRPLLQTQLEADTAKALNQLSEIRQVPVRLYWVRGHQGCIGNEAADQTAKEWACSTTAVPMQLPVTKVQVKKQLRVAERKSVKDLFDKLPVSKNKLRPIALNTRLVPSSLSRASICKVGAVLNNRAPLRVGLAYKGINTTCQRCNLEAEDNLHLLGTCPALHRQRSNTLGFPVLTEQQIMDCKPASLAQFLNVIGL